MDLSLILFNVICFSWLIFAIFVASIDFFCTWQNGYHRMASFTFIEGFFKAYGPFPLVFLLAGYYL